MAVRLTDRQRRFLSALDRAIENGGKVSSHQAIDADGWFFPIDIFLGAGTVAAQLYRKGILQREECGWTAVRWRYKKPLAP